jgi:hypothetical protein
MQDNRKLFQSYAKKNGIPLRAVRLSKYMDLVDRKAYCYIFGPFKSGYTLSVIRHAGSYGGRNGLFEVAPMLGHDILYYTAIAPNDGVKGHLSKQEVFEAVEKVMTWDGTENFPTGFRPIGEEA